MITGIVFKRFGGTMLSGPETAPPPLRENRAFQQFMIARTVSWAGSAITLVTLPLLLYQRTGSASLTALLVVTEAVPYLAFGLVAGALADTWSRRRILIMTSSINAALIATIPLSSVFDLLTTTQLLLVAGTSATMSVFFDAACFGILPTLVGRQRLPEATSSGVAAYTIVGLIGPMTGGLLATSLGSSYAIAIDSLSFAIAAALLHRALKSVDDIRETCQSALPYRIRTQIADGLRFIWRNKLVRTLTFLGIGNSLASGAVLGLLVATVVERIGLADDDSRIGFFYAATALGALIAATIGPRLGRQVSVGWITVGGLAGNWLLLMVWASVTNLALGLIILMLWQMMNTLVALNGIVTRQQVTPDDLQSRVNTTARMIAWAGQPLGAAGAAIIAGQYGIRVALLSIGLAVLVSCLIAVVTLFRGAFASNDVSRESEFDERSDQLLVSVSGS